MRAAVVTNPTKTSRDELAAVVEPANEAAGYEPVLWLETTPEEPGFGLARRAVDEGVDVVLAVGGDGTVRSVAEGLRDSAIPLALCAQGTGNLLARNLGLPINNLAGSVDVAYSGEARPVDLGMVELRAADGSTAEHGFVVMAGMGLDAKIMATTDADLKKKVGRLAYVKAGAEAIRRDEQFRVSYRLDGRSGRSRVNTVLIGNCGSIGGYVYLMPDAEVDDGLLDVLALRPTGRFGWLRVIKRVIIDHLIRRLANVPTRTGGEVRHAQVQRVELRLKEPHEVELDGDPFGKVIGLRAWIEPRALRVMMPAGYNAGRLA